MSDVLQPGVTELLAVLAKASVVVAGGLLLSSLRRANPALRHSTLLAATCGVLALPLLAVVAPRWEAPVLPSMKQEVAPAAAARSGSTDPRLSHPDEAQAIALGVRSVAAGRPAGVAVASPHRGNDAGPGRRAPMARLLLITIWSLGTLALLARLLIGRLRLRSIAASAWEPDDACWRALLEEEKRLAGVVRQVRLLVSPAATAPMTWGTRRPVVLLPEDSLEWSAERRRIVLRHELAHIARGDALAQLLSAVACAAYWFHPLVLIAATRLRIECERACDARVVALGTAPREYASHLLDVARAAREMSAPRLLSLAMARRSQLEGRLCAVLDTCRPRSAPTRRSRAVMIGLPLTLAAAGSAFHPVVRTATGDGVSAAAPQGASARTAVNERSIALAPVPAPSGALTVESIVAAAATSQARPDAAPPAGAGEPVPAIASSGDTALQPPHFPRADTILRNVEILLRADLTLPSDSPVRVVLSREENLVLVNDGFALPLDLRSAIELLKQIRAKHGRDVPGGSAEIAVASSRERPMSRSAAEPYAHLLTGLLNAPMEVLNVRPAARHQLFEEHPVVEVAVSDSTLARLMRRSP